MRAEKILHRLECACAIVYFTGATIAILYILGWYVYCGFVHGLP